MASYISWEAATPPPGLLMRKTTDRTPDRFAVVLQLIDKFLGIGNDPFQIEHRDLVAGKEKAGGAFIRKVDGQSKEAEDEEKQSSPAHNDPEQQI